MIDKNPFAVGLGKLGGLAKSEAKQRASASNWAKAMAGRARRPLGMPYKKPSKVTVVADSAGFPVAEVRYGPVPGVAHSVPVVTVAQSRPRRDFHAGLVPKPPEEPKPNVLRTPTSSPVGETTREPFVENP